MAYYYVKSGGTATGDGGRTVTQRTGLWNTTATEYYASLRDCIGATTTPTDGDYICISHLSTASYTYTTHLVFNSGGTAGAAGLVIISVDNANQENYLPGASDENTSTSWRIGFDKEGAIYGCTIINAAEMQGEGSMRTWHIVDSTLKFGAGSDDLVINSDGNQFILKNSILDFSADVGGVAGSATIQGGSLLDMSGGSVLYNAAATSNFVKAGYQTGGATATFTGVDLTQVTNSLVAGLNNASVHDTVNVTFTNCTIDSTVSIMQTVPTSIRHRVEMYGTDDTTGDDLHRFHIENGAGKVINNDATYVTATETWYGGSVKSSMEVTTTSLTSHLHPFVFELPAQYVDLSQAASDVLTLELTTETAVTLTDTDIAAFLCYPDGTTSVIPNWVTSSGSTAGTGNWGIDPMAAGTTLTTGSLGAGDWTGEDATSPNFYKMVLDTSGDAGQATVVSIRIEVYKASIAAGTLFIHPLLTLS